jgi:hypothetical protein
MKQGASHPFIRPGRPRRAFDRDSRATPALLLARLDQEFGFTLDPCPFDPSGTAGASLWGKDGLRMSWAGQRVFCNPPYSDIAPWLAKADEANVAVYLLPSRTDVRWWHDAVIHRASEVRFIRGRLCFGDNSGPAPFASIVAVFDRPRFTPFTARRWVDTEYRSMSQPE